MGSGPLSTNSTANPDFHDFNHVYVPYCSGDVWLGTQADAVDPWGGAGSGDQRFVFTGHAIVQAAVAKLKQYAGGDGSAVRELLLEGCSAGGIGTFNNADWV